MVGPSLEEVLATVVRLDAVVLAQAVRIAELEQVAARVPELEAENARLRE